MNPSDHYKKRARTLLNAISIAVDNQNVQNQKWKRPRKNPNQSFLHAIFVNIEGVQRNLKGIREIATQLKPHIIILAETWEIESPPDINGYDKFFVPATETGGRPSKGLGLYINHTSPVQFTFNQAGTQNRIAKLSSTGPVNIEVIGAYAPQHDSPDRDLFFAELSATINPHTNSLLLADLNARLGHLTGDSTSNLSQIPLLKLLAEKTLQINKPKYLHAFPATCKGISRGSSVIDYCISPRNQNLQTESFRTETACWFDNRLATHHAVISASILVENALPKNKPKTKWAEFPDSHPVWATYREKIAEKLGKHRYQLQNPPTDQASFDTYLALIVNILVDPMEKIQKHHAGAKKAAGNPPSRPNFWLKASNYARKSPHWETTISDQIKAQRREIERDATHAVKIIIEGAAEHLSKNPGLCWKAINAHKRASRNQLPPAMKSTNSNRLTTNPEKIQLAFWEIFHRKKWIPKNQEIKDIHAKRIHQNKIWAKLRDSTEYDSPPSFKESLKALNSMNTHGKSGQDTVTVQMIKNAGKEIQIIIHDLICEIWIAEIIPTDFLKDMLIPIHKKLSILDPVNYRPISLMSAIAKWFQKILWNRIKLWDATQPNGGICSHSAYGGVKGRCRLMAAWTINAQSLLPQNLKTHHFIFTSDINNAYPSTDANVTDYILRQAGLSGRLWRLSRKIEKGLKTNLKLNDRVTEQRAQERGLNQGAIPSSTRFNATVAPLYKTLEEEKIGTSTEDHTIPPIGFIDDCSGCTTEEKLHRYLIIRESFADKHGLEWKTTKDAILNRGTSNPSSPFKNRDGIIEIKKSVEVLGEILTKNPSRSPQQVQDTIERMKNATIKYRWISWSSSIPSTKVAYTIFNAMVISIARARLIITRVKDHEWKKIESIQAQIARDILKVHQRASVIPTLAELGWTSLKTIVSTEKLLFAGRIFREAKAIHTMRTRDIRIHQVNQGDKQGFLGEIHEIMQEWNIPHLWAKPMKRSRWKKQIKEAARRHEIQKWKNWINDSYNPHFT